MGESLNRSSIKSKTFEQKTDSEKIREILICKGDYVAVVDNEQRFESIVYRKVIINKTLGNIVERIN